MKPFLIGDTIEELGDTGSGILEIAVFAAITSSYFRVFHERFTGRIGEGVNCTA